MNFLFKPFKYGLFCAFLYPTYYLLSCDTEKKEATYKHPIVYGINLITYSIRGFWSGVFSYIIYENINNIIDCYLKQIGSSQ
jgi:hypothetical protein